MSSTNEVSVKQATLADYPGYIFYEDGSIYSPLTGKLVRRKTTSKAYQLLHYRTEDGTKKCVLAHIVLAKAFLGERPEGHVVDHIDRNKQNNAVSNLRYVTLSQNFHNSQLSDNKSSRFYGVTKQDNRYRAQVSVNGEIEWLGNYPDEVTAAQVYDARVRALGLNRLVNFN